MQQKQIVKLSNMIKEQIIAEVQKQVPVDATEAEIAQCFFDKVQKDLVPVEKHVGYDKWTSVRNWLVKGVRTPRVVNKEPEDLKKLIKQQVEESLLDGMKGFIRAHNEQVESINSQIVLYRLESQAKVNTLSMVVVDLVKALKDVFVTLELQQHTLSVEVNKEIKRIAKEVSPSIEMVEDAADTRYSVVIIGLLANQEQVIKEKFGKSLKLTFVTSQQAAKNKAMTHKYKNADVIIGMTGFMSHSGSFNQFKHKLKTINGGMTTLIGELEALCNIIKVKVKE